MKSKLSNDLWVRTDKRNKIEVTEEAHIRADLLGHRITNIYSIQNQFKHNECWHSYVWYNYILIKKLKQN